MKHFHRYFITKSPDAVNDFLTAHKHMQDTALALPESW